MWPNTLHSNSFFVRRLKLGAMCSLSSWPPHLQPSLPRSNKVVVDNVGRHRKFIWRHCEFPFSVFFHNIIASSSSWISLLSPTLSLLCRGLFTAWFPVLSLFGHSAASFFVRNLAWGRWINVWWWLRHGSMMVCDEFVFLCVGEWCSVTLFGELQWLCRRWQGAYGLCDGG